MLSWLQSSRALFNNYYLLTYESLILLVELCDTMLLKGTPWVAQPLSTNFPQKCNIHFKCIFALKEFYQESVNIIPLSYEVNLQLKLCIFAICSIF